MANIEIQEIHLSRDNNRIRVTGVNAITFTETEVRMNIGFRVNREIRATAAMPTNNESLVASENSEIALVPDGRSNVLLPFDVEVGEGWTAELLKWINKWNDPYYDRTVPIEAIRVQFLCSVNLDIGSGSNSWEEISQL